METATLVVKTFDLGYSDTNVILENILRRISFYNKQIAQCDELIQISDEKTAKTYTHKRDQYTALLAQYEPMLQKSAAVGMIDGKRAVKFFDNLRDAIEYRKTTEEMEVEYLHDFPTLTVRF